MKAILVLAALAALPGGGQAATDACNPPACHKPSCQKVCRIVCEMKKIEKTVWVVECEEFCVPNPGCPARACGCRQGGCEACRHAQGCGKPCGPPPQCGPVRCRQKLVKKTITCEVPVYKCVVVACGCGDCAAALFGEPTKAEEPKQAYVPAPLPMP